MRKLLVNNKDTKKIEYHCPIDFVRLVATIKGMKTKKNALEDLVSPVKAVKELERLHH